MSILKDLFLKIQSHMEDECEDPLIYIETNQFAFGKIITCKCGKKWDVPFTAAIQAEKDEYHFSKFESAICLLNGKDFKIAREEKRRKKKEEESMKKRMENLRNPIRSLEV